MLDKDVTFTENNIGNFFHRSCTGHTSDKTLKPRGINNDTLSHISVCDFFTTQCIIISAYVT